MMIRFSKTSRLCFAIMVWILAFSQAAAEDRESVNRILSKPTIRGGIVFKAYCVLCHGEQGDGRARATTLYGILNLRIGDRSPEYFENIVRHGGVGVARSQYMPPWEGELSEEQILDVVAYLEIVTHPARRGEVVFSQNCILCHGPKGDGKGRAAVLYNPPPADLTRSDKNKDYKRMIITFGGAAMGRSSVMPVWGEQLTAQEIEDLVTYLDTLLTVPN